MLDALSKSLVQLLSPAFRAMLLRTMAVALLLLVLVGVGLHRALVWLAAFGESWAERMLGTGLHAPLELLAWIFAVAVAFGVIIGSVFLMPAVTALVGSFLVDDIALAVEREHYPDEPVGTPVPAPRAILEGAKAALLALLVYLVALPLVLIAGLGGVIFFAATAYLLGRQYFELAAMRYRPAGEAKMLRKRYQGRIFMAGMMIAAFVSVPVISLATPFVATALMVHIHKWILAETGQNATIAGNAEQALHG
jgi:uncharacterized protein involved in cysteine biosynthesis